MRLFDRTKRTLKIVTTSGEVEVWPGDYLFLEHKATIVDGMVEAEVKVTYKYDWDGETLKVVPR